MISREDARDELADATIAYRKACSEVQKILKRYPFMDMRSPQVMADLAVKRWVQSEAQKRRMRANAIWLSFSSPLPSAEQGESVPETPKSKKCRESIPPSEREPEEEPHWFKIIAEAAKMHPTYKPSSAEEPSAQNIDQEDQLLNQIHEDISELTSEPSPPESSDKEEGESE